MAETYRFDPRAVAADIHAIQEWCHVHGIDPLATPTDATVVIDGPHITIDQFVTSGRGRPMLNPEKTDVMRTKRVVPLIARPELASLKPVETAADRE